MKKTVIFLVLIILAITGWRVFVNQDVFQEQEKVEDLTANEVSERIVGKWKSTTDPKAEIIFNSEGSFVDLYDAEQMSVGEWSVTQKAEGEKTKIILRTNINNVLYEYSVWKVDDLELVLNYLARGNTLEYFRISETEQNIIETPEGWLSFSSEEYGANFSYPNDWEVVESVKPKNEKAFHEIVVWETEYDLWRGMLTISVFDNSEQKTVENWWNHWILEEEVREAECKQEYGDTAPCLFMNGRVENQEEIQLAGQEAIHVELFSFDHQEHCTYLASGKYFYGICAPGGENPNDENWEEHNEIVDKIKQTLIFD